MTKISKAQFLPETQGTLFPGSLFCLPLEQERGKISPEEDTAVHVACVYACAASENQANLGAYAINKATTARYTKYKFTLFAKLKHRFKSFRIKK